MTEFIGKKVITSLELIETYENTHFGSDTNYDFGFSSKEKKNNIIEARNADTHDLIDSITGTVLFKSKNLLEKDHGVYYSRSKKRCFITPENFVVNRNFTDRICQVKKLDGYVILYGEKKCNIFKIGRSKPVMTVNGYLQLPSMTYIVDNNLYCAFNPKEPLLTDNNITVIGNIIKTKMHTHWFIDNTTTKIYKIVRTLV